MSHPGDEPTRIDPAEGEPTRAFEPVGPDRPDGPPPVVPGPGGPLPPPPPDRRVWIIVALAAVVLALLALLLLGGDDDDDDDASTADTSTSVSTTTTLATSSTAAVTSTVPAPATTEATPTTLDPDDCEAAGANAAQPGIAAETVFQAWTLDDVACADRLMTGDALSELFSRDGEGATDDFQGCTEVDEPDPHADCAFTHEGGSTHYLMSFSPTDGWQVFDVEQSAD